MTPNFEATVCRLCGNAQGGGGEEGARTPDTSPVERSARSLTPLSGGDATAGSSVRRVKTLRSAFENFHNLSQVNCQEERCI